MNFLSWLFRPPEPKEAFTAGPEVFSPEQQKIYVYWNGQKNPDGSKVWIQADPMPLYKELLESGPEIAGWIAVIQVESKDAGKAHNDLCARLRMIFNIPPLVNKYQFPPNGTLTDTAVGLLMDHFMAFAERVKKNSPTTPTPATAPSPNTEPSSVAPSNTSNGSDSGSTAGGPSTDLPAPSLSVPVSPAAT
jgi:hypothetical protein